MDIFSFMDCEGCPHYSVRRGSASGDPDSCWLDEAECSDGDFGNDRPCERMLSRIKEGLEDGDFGFSRSFLLTRWHFADITIREIYWDVLSAWPDVDWDSHAYWQLFYDTTDPVGFDTVEEVYEEVFL
jgi:hypothetical protein